MIPNNLILCKFMGRQVYVLLLKMIATWVVLETTHTKLILGIQSPSGKNNIKFLQH